MRILHILDHSLPLHSGYTFRTAAILREQRRLGWETFHLTSAKQGPTPASEETADGLRFFRTSLETAAWARWPVLNQAAIVRGLTRRLREVVEQVNPDVLHAHSPALNGLAALPVARHYRLPLVYEVRAFWEDAAVDHGTTREGSVRYRLTRALETHVLKRAAAVTCICEGLRSDIVARGIPAAKVTVIPNAVDIGQFNLGGEPDLVLKARLGLTGARVLGFIGSFYAYEGLALLLDALPAMLAQAPDIRVLLVGGGPQEQALKAQAQNLGIADQVVFTGRVPHAEVNHYYHLVDVLVYPRLSMRLTELVTPLKPLEAMAQGQLFIASDVGGHRELIHDGATGVLFRAGDANDLAAKILVLLDQPERWPLLKVNGRRFVETERNWTISVKRYTPIYQALASAA
ncbi:MAG TPA: glycosyltransferase, exosortase A system-associated [Candidatus Competibacteraceae bacterium]|nr:glycosyltransferase, exosortase A system-associated [Candidatus Competibacter sp.]MDG4605284.1 glycosyltransferase, exosortase A system-associated [Candidatus Contendobacter sp.]HRD48156.1 glycosyltransferase, exosortase A system-associated [Candidatus Contendobacter sp.]HRF45367.1 glycosyltransferase, exosortase A system-associated [Candidatus Competibacteraceae bacterium]